MKRAFVYNPYWDTQGGGEKYCLAVVATLSEMGYQVEVPWPDENLFIKLQDRYQVELKGALVKPDLAVIFQQNNFYQKIKISRDYEVSFWVSDGSLPWLWSKKNLLHFQVPFAGVNGGSLINQLKLKTQTVVCNSQFTKQVIDREFKCEAAVLYPPVRQMTPLPKKPVILSVGRFDNSLHSKRQDVLIEAFSRLERPDWQLILAGGSLQGKENIKKLQDQAQNKRVTFVVNPNYQTLVKLYGEAKIYWHAAGYGEDLEAHPEKAEHFGISTVEAMSAAAVPAAFKGGGQTEIIEDGTNGYLWSTVPQLVSLTQGLIDNEPRLQQLSVKAKERARLFEEAVFSLNFSKLI